ncbi:MAG: MOSC domain-containing protein [Acidimicrobiales bacterium]
MTIGLAAVNVGVPRVLADAARTGGDAVWSGIAKQPVAAGTTLWLSLVNLSGDGQADLTVHGGLDKAVYAYPSEHLAEWAAELEVDATELGPAAFGENLATIGVTEADVFVGDVWGWGDALLEVCQPRWPCFKLALHRGRADIQQRMRRNGRTGWYLRVLQPGEVPVDGPIEVARRDPAAISIADAHVAMGDRHLDHHDLVAAAAAHDRLAEEWRGPLRERLARS